MAALEKGPAIIGAGFIGLPTGSLHKYQERDHQQIEITIHQTGCPGGGKRHAGPENKYRHHLLSVQPIQAAGYTGMMLAKLIDMCMTIET